MVTLKPSMPPFQDNHVVIFHPKKVSCIRMDSKTLGHLMGRKPSVNHLSESFLGGGIAHEQTYLLK